MLTDRERIVEGWSGCCPALARSPGLDAVCLLVEAIRAAGFDALAESFLKQLAGGGLSLLFEMIFCRWLLRRHPPGCIEYEPPPVENPNGSPPDFRLRLSDCVVDFQLKFIEQLENEFAVAKFQDEVRRQFKNWRTPTLVDLAFGPTFAGEDIGPALKWLTDEMRNPTIGEWTDYRDSNGDIVLRARPHARQSEQGLIIAGVFTHVGLSAQDGGPALVAREIDTTGLRKKCEKVLTASKKSLQIAPSEQHLNVVVLGINQKLMPTLEELFDTFYGTSQHVARISDGIEDIRPERARDGLFCLGRKPWLNAALILDPASSLLADKQDFYWLPNPVHFGTFDLVSQVDPEGTVMGLKSWEWVPPSDKVE